MVPVSAPPRVPPRLSAVFPLLSPLWRVGLRPPLRRGVLPQPSRAPTAPALPALSPASRAWRLSSFSLQTFFFRLLLGRAFCFGYPPLSLSPFLRQPLLLCFLVSGALGCGVLCGAAFCLSFLARQPLLLCLLSRLPLALGGLSSFSLQTFFFRLLLGRAFCFGLAPFSLSPFLRQPLLLCFLVSGALGCGLLCGAAFRLSLLARQPLMLYLPLGGVSSLLLLLIVIRCQGPLCRLPYFEAVIISLSTLIGLPWRPVLVPHVCPAGCAPVRAPLPRAARGTKYSRGPAVGQKAVRSVCGPPWGPER